MESGHRRYTKAALSVPNREVMQIYYNTVDRWIETRVGFNNYRKLLRNLLEGEIEIFEDKLNSYIRDSVGLRDVTRDKSEDFYQGVLMGLVSATSEDYDVESNKESGTGYPDIMILPKDNKKLGIIMELKVSYKEEKLEEDAQQGLDQINQKEYISVFKKRGIKDVMLMGISFYGKKLKIEFERVDS